MELTCRSMTTLGGAVVRRTCRLPLSGEILVKPGDAVEPPSIVGYNSSEECLHFLRLDTDDRRLLAKLLKHVGDNVKRGEPVAYYMYFFGLGYTEYVSPVNGAIISFDEGNGLLAIREHPVPVRSGLFGTVESVIPGHSATILSRGAWIEGTAGWGGKAFGELLMLVSSADEVLDPVRAGPHVRGKIVVAGSFVDGRTLIALYRHGARGVVAGGVDRLAADEFAAMSEQMTYEEYAARFYAAGQADHAGEEGLDRVIMSVLAVDGFGKVPIRPEAFELLKANEGRIALLEGVEPGPAGDGRPELLITVPWDGPLAIPDADEVYGPLTPGTRVRVIGGRHHGAAGNVLAADNLEAVLPTGMRVTGAAVELDSKVRLTLPLANLEVIRAEK
jgi:hypothetical protein